MVSNTVKRCCVKEIGLDQRHGCWCVGQEFQNHNTQHPVQPYNLPMFIPTITIHISGNVVAVYGAILSTITAAVQVVTHFKDRVRLLIRMQHNMETVNDPVHQGMTMTLMNVTNAGRRPVTITGLGAYRLYPHNPFFIVETNPHCPCELTEGKQMVGIINQKGLDLSVMESWEAYTATGKTFQHSVVPWYRKWWNRRKLRKQWKKKDTKKQEV